MAISTRERAAGPETASLKTYETQSWIPGEVELPTLIDTLANTVKSRWLANDQGWKNTFVKAAIIDTKGLKQSLESYINDGPNESSPEMLVVGFQFTSENAPLKRGFGDRDINTKAAVAPFFSGTITKVEKKDEFYLKPLEDSELFGRDLSQAVREGRLFSLGRLRVTTDSDMGIVQAFSIRELAGIPRYYYNLYFHITLTDVYRFLRDREERAIEERKTFEAEMPEEISRNIVDSTT